MPKRSDVIENTEKPDLRTLIQKLPKADLHVHLDGSVRLETLIEIAKHEKIKLPSYTVAGLNKLVFKDHYRNQEEYLKTFGYTDAVMQKPEYLKQIAYEFAVDNQAEGIRYTEVRITPQIHMNKYMPLEEVIRSVDNGLKRAQLEFNQHPDIKSGREPPFHYGIIACALRSFGAYSEYLSSFLNSHPFSDSKSLFGLCSLELVQGIVKCRDRFDLPIVAIDLTGAESGNPPKDHWRTFQFANENFLGKTVHAGEAYGPPSIFQAITELYTERIGHGFYLFDVTKIDDKFI